MNDKDMLYSISELAKLFDITPRAVRFYEDKGLIHPQRIGGNRVYNYRDRARIKLILRLKAVGFTLDAIKGYMDLYNADTSGITQLKHGFAHIMDRIEKNRRQINKLQSALNELEDLKNEAIEMLKQRNVNTAELFKN